MSSAAQRAVRAGAPWLAASAAFGLWVLRPGNAYTSVALLVCPGWGLLRVLSVVDRRGGVLGACLMLSLLVHALCTELALRYGLPASQLGLAVHVVTLGLCLLGGLRISRHVRWQAAQPPHPAPMPLWPARPVVCALLLLAALGALFWASPIGAPPLGSDLPRQAARAAAWARGGEDPLLAGMPLPASSVLAAAGAALGEAAGIHPLRACGLLVAATLAASLALAAEAISRLRGNRGGTRAMLALLLGLKPLALLFLVGQPADPTDVGPGFHPRFSTALEPWIAGSSLAAALGFTALLLSSTLSVLRRATYHVPRLAGVAAFGLVLARPSAAVLLLPGWLVGIALCHLSTRTHPDNDPHAAHRPGEPAWLRAPFWALAIPIAAGGLFGVLVAGAPPLQAGLSTSAAWGLLAAVGPACVLFLPGIRHLHRSPGREAFFFVGLLCVAVPTAMLLGEPGDRGDLGMRLLALVLAVPAANGALRLIDVHGPRASTMLTLLVLFALPGPLALVVSAATGPRAVLVDGRGAPTAPRLHPSLEDALETVARRAPPDAVLLAPDDLSAADGPVAALVSGRSLLLPPEAPAVPQPGTTAAVRPPSAANAAEISVRRALATRVPAGDATALLGLRGRPGLATRELWTVGTGDAPAGFVDSVRLPSRTVARAPVPDVVLVTLEGLRDDELRAASLPRSHAALSGGLRLEQAVSPVPANVPALASLLTGLAPAEHRVLAPDDRYAGDAPTLAARYARRGYRTAAVVALDQDGGLLGGFDRVTRVPGGQAGLLADMALAVLSEADPRPLFLWMHLSDVARTHGTPAAAAGRRAADEALARLLESLPPHDLVLVTSPYGLPRADEPPGAPLPESAWHVPLLVLGAGLPAGVAPGLVSLADVPDLLLRGETPRRASVLLASPDGRPLPAGLRTPTRMTLLLKAADATGGPSGLGYALRDDPLGLRPAPADERALLEVQRRVALSFR